MRVFFSALLVLLAPASPQRARQESQGGEEYPHEVVPAGAIYGHLTEGFFSQPMGVFFDASAGELFVADTMNGLIGIFDEEGIPLFAFGGRSVLTEPVEVATTRDGAILVLHGAEGEIKPFSYRGDPRPPLRFAYPAADGRPAGTARVGAFAVDAEGGLYVADRDSPQVLVYGRDGELRLAIRSRPGGAVFGTISGIAVSSEGRIAVVDSSATPVQIFDPEGELLAAFGERGIALGDFVMPVDLAFDQEGYLYVVDMSRHDVKIFDQAGHFHGRFGGWYSPETRGRSPGEMLYPMGIAIAPGGLIYVAERYGHRIQLFRRQPKGTRESRGGGSGGPGERSERPARAGDG